MTQMDGAYFDWYFVNLRGEHIGKVRPKPAIGISPKQTLIELSSQNLLIATIEEPQFSEQFF